MLFASEQRVLREGGLARDDRAHGGHLLQRVVALEQRRRRPLKVGQQPRVDGADTAGHERGGGAHHRLDGRRSLLHEPDAYRKVPGKVQERSRKRSLLCGPDAGAPLEVADRPPLALRVQQDRGARAAGAAGAAGAVDVRLGVLRRAVLHSQRGLEVSW